MNSKIVNDPEKVELTLFDGVLNSDEMMILKDKWYFVKHNKAQVKITFYTYANEWSDRKNERYFKTLENAVKWYKKNMLDRVILQGGVWLSESGDDDPEIKKITEIINKDYNTAIEKMTEEQKALCVDEWESLTLYCEI